MFVCYELPLSNAEHALAAGGALSTLREIGLAAVGRRTITKDSGRPSTGVPASASAVAVSEVLRTRPPNQE